MGKGAALLANTLVGATLFLGVAGCGLPAVPQPPSLDLPLTVSDLQARRIGDLVRLTWTEPSLNTDRTATRPGLQTNLCRKDSVAAKCLIVQLVPAKPGDAVQYDDELPPELRRGPLRAVSYQVEVQNAKGRSAGWSAAEPALAGASAPQLTALQATSTASGVRLSWQGSAPAPADGQMVYRITRTLLTQRPAAEKSPLAQRVPDIQTLQLPATDTAGQALDGTAALDQQYRYQVQAVVQARVDDGSQLRTLEMAGLPSNAVNVATKSVFPPSAPQGLQAVAIWKGDTPGADLSWQPNTEPTLAGYRVYRITRFHGRSLERRDMVSGAKLLTTPSFADRGLAPATDYVYSVVAVDLSGNVSPESAQVTVTTQAAPD